MNQSLHIPFSTKARAFYTLTKPGIIMGNAITMSGGFALASQGKFNLFLFCATLIGLSFIIASACIFNNVIDKERDAKMERTKNRPLVLKTIDASEAVLFAMTLLFSGVSLLKYFTNGLTTLIAIVGFFLYVIVYSFAKYQTEHATIMGSVSGAIPPVVGYCALANALTPAAWLLFAMIALWQMPHFFAIAIYRLEDYRRADIPVLPLRRGIERTKKEILFYTVLFGIVSVMPALFHYTGILYLLIAILLGCGWTFSAIRGFYTQDTVAWARKHFLYSLIVVTVLCGTFFIP